MNAFMHSLVSDMALLSVCILHKNHWVGANLFLRTVLLFWIWLLYIISLKQERGTEIVNKWAFPLLLLLLLLLISLK